jgi:hypothetical protein
MLSDNKWYLCGHGHDMPLVGLFIYSQQAEPAFNPVRQCHARDGCMHISQRYISDCVISVACSFAGKRVLYEI